MRVLKTIYRIVLGGAALAWVPALQAQSPSDFLAVRKITLDPATSSTLIVVENVGERRITGCAVLVGSRQYTQEFVYSVGIDPQVLRSRPAGFGGLEPGETMQFLFPPSGSGSPLTAHINAVIFDDRTAVGAEEQIASMFRQRLAYASEWGRWALVMEEDPARPRSDVARGAEIAEMIRVLPEDPEKSGSAAAVAGRMAARRALRSLLMQSKPETRAALLAYVQERAATLRRHAQREGPIGYIAPAVALVNDMGKRCETPSAGPVITQESACGLPGAPLSATARSTAFCAQASAGQTAKTSSTLSAAALGSCGVVASEVRTYAPECKPEFFTTTSSAASSATITGMAYSYVPVVGCAARGSQAVTALIVSAHPNYESAAVETLAEECCSNPASETSEASTWISGAGGSVGGTFMMTLTGSGSFAGRTINEDFNSLEDTCYWAGSGKDKLTLASVRGKVAWPVTSLNKYGPDLISVATDWAVYYQNAIKATVAPYTSCYVNVRQQMLIDCGSTMQTYGTAHDTKNIIRANESEATRDTASIKGAIAGQ